MAAIYDLYVEQGAYFIQSIDLEGDWTGSTLEISIKDSKGYSIEGTCTWTDITNGQFDIIIVGNKTELASKGVGKYNINANKPDLKVDRIMQGRIYIDEEV